MAPSPVPSVIEIGPRDAALQAAFCDYVPQVFKSIDFRRWCEWGEWNDDYRAFAVVEDGRVLANVSVMRMRLRLEGRDVTGFQLGAVGCLPSRRGRGLSRGVMEAALDFCGDAPVLLFANPTVLDYYPRFGFAPWRQELFAAPHDHARALRPARAAPAPHRPAHPAYRVRLHPRALVARGDGGRRGHRGPPVRARAAPLPRAPPLPGAGAYLKRHRRPREVRAGRRWNPTGNFSSASSRPPAAGCAAQAAGGWRRGPPRRPR